MPPALLQSKVQAAPDLTPIPPGAQPSTTPSGELQFEYAIKVANRGKQAVFYATFNFEGVEAPEAVVHVNKKGMVVKRAEVSEITRKNDGQLIGLIVSWLAAATATVGCATLMFQTLKLRKSSGEIRNMLENIPKQVMAGDLKTATQVAMDCQKITAEYWKMGKRPVDCIYKPGGGIVMMSA